MSAGANLPCTLTGELGKLPSAEVVNLVHNLKKSGRLDVQAREVRRSIFFQDGEIVFAASEAKEDRLGECLLRAGRINLQQFEEASRRMQSKEKLGKILVDMKVLTPGQLWVGVKNQVEEIFYLVLKAAQGNFFFYEGPVQLENAVRLPRSVRSLILEAVRSREEFKVFVEKIINRSTVFLPLQKPTDLSLTDIEEEVFSLIDGQKSVRQVLLESSTTSLVTLKILSNLMMARLILPKDLLGNLVDKNDALPEIDEEKEPAPQADQSEFLKSFIGRYNRVFREIGSTFRDYGVEAGPYVGEYLKDTDSPFTAIWVGLFWLETGGIEDGRLLANLSSQDQAARNALASRALEDLLFFLLFKAQETLPKEIYGLLVKTVEEMHQGVEA